jgi:sec-independent protein translocase protein TatA
MPSIGPMELIIVLVIALVIIGPKKLPGAAKSLGTSMRGFKESLTGGSEPAALHATADEPPAESTRAQTTAAPAPAAH